MKLIIDIQDFVYNHIKEFNSTQLYELNVISAIKNGEPLEKELEKIKAEIKDLHNSHMIHLIDTDGAVDTCLEIIDEHIAELKGE